MIKQFALKRNICVWAKELAADFDACVYLCGSALYKDDPRDWDVRIILTDCQFAERYGGTVQEWTKGLETGHWVNINWNQSNDNVARTKEGWAKTRLNIDFQVYPESFSKYDHLPKMMIPIREVKETV